MGLLDKITNVRENIERRVDTQRIETRARAEEERAAREKQIAEEEAQGKISKQLADRWRKRADEKYESKRKPFGDKVVAATNKISRAVEGVATNVAENQKREAAKQRAPRAAPKQMPRGRPRSPLREQKYGFKAPMYNRGEAPPQRVHPFVADIQFVAPRRKQRGGRLPPGMDPFNF